MDFDNMMTYAEKENEVLEFENLELATEFSREEATVPVFFMPCDGPKNKLHNSLVKTTEEPFMGAVFPFCNMYIDFVGNEDSINKMAYAIMDQANALLVSNANIIFQNGLINEMSMLIKPENMPNIMGIYNTYIPYSFPNPAVIEVYEAIKKEYKNKNHDDVYMKNMVILFTKGRASITRYLSNEVYKFINEALMSGYADTAKILNHICGFNYDDDAYEYDPRTSLSICMTHLLDIANRDINKIMEIYEFILVNEFYRLTDLLNYAAKNKIELKSSNPCNFGGSFVEF